MNDSLYKIFRSSEWQTFQNGGKFGGSADDLRDGFIHMSTASQLAGTLAKHFLDIPEIILARFDTNQLKGIQWEISRNGEKFPHIYGHLISAALREHIVLAVDANGVFNIPKKFLGTS